MVKIICGLDVGSHTIQALASQLNKEGELEVLGAVQSAAAGLRQGLVNNLAEAAAAIKRTVAELEEASGRKIHRVYASLSGSHLVSRFSRGVVAVSLPDGEITRSDVERVINAARAISLSQNREVIQVIPKEFIVDGEGGIKNPIGMYGVRLEVNALVIDGVSNYVKNFQKAINLANLEVVDWVVVPLAACRAVLSKRQKEVGVGLVDLGGAITALAVFDDGQLIHHALIPFGAQDITGEIAIALKTSMDIAEKVKLEYGICDPKEVRPRAMIDLASLGEGGEGCFSQKEVAKVIESQLTKLFELVNKELKKIDRKGRLPGGVVFVGGGAKIPRLLPLARKILKLPAQLGYAQEMAGLTEAADDPAFATALGLVLKGRDNLLGEDDLEPKLFWSRSKILRFFRHLIP